MEDSGRYLIHYRDATRRRIVSTCPGSWTTWYRVKKSGFSPAAAWTCRLSARLVCWRALRWYVRPSVSTTISSVGYQKSTMKPLSERCVSGSGRPTRREIGRKRRSRCESVQTKSHL